MLSLKRWNLVNMNLSSPAGSGQICRIFQGFEADGVLCACLRLDGLDQVEGSLLPEGRCGGFRESGGFGTQGARSLAT